MTVKQKIVVAFLAGALVLLVGVLSLVTVEQLLRSTRNVDRTVDVILRLEHVVSLLKDAETGQRGFLITGDSTYLRPYVIARDSLPSLLATLHRLHDRFPVRSAKLDTLTERVAEKLEELQENIAVRADQGFGAAAQLVRTDRGQVVMDDARRLVRDLEQRETTVRAALETERRAATGRVLWVIGGGTLLAVALLISINKSIGGDVQRELLVRRELEESRREQATANSRLSLIARVGEHATASLEEQETLAGFARLLVPELADWVVLSVASEDGRVRETLGVHRDPAKERQVRELARTYAEPYAHGVVASVLNTSRTEYYDEISPSLLAAVARDAQHLELLKSLGMSSAIIAPLVARGRTMGTVMLVRSNPSARYSPEDVTLAETAAARAAIGVDNARLIAEAREARALALAASKAKSDFLATMSHEIRTPINAILGYAQLLELGVSGGLTDEQRRQVERIVSSTRHLLMLVNEVLDLAKVESGTLEVRQDAAVAGNTVDAALDLVRPLAAEKGVRLSEQCEGERAAAYFADEPRVRQILVNLIGNAIKFTEAGGEVTIQCALGAPSPDGAHTNPDGDYVAIRVRDSGIGIPHGQLDAIFEPFVQAAAEGENAYTRRRMGTGLGLAISRQLARRMHGDITVESEPGRGSTFTLWLPAAHVASKAQEAFPDEVTSGRVAAPPVPRNAAARSPRVDRDGYAVAAETLLNGVPAVLKRWRDRVRAAVPEAHSATDAEIDDHGATMITDVAVSLRAAANRSYVGGELLRDGAAIMRTLAEQHGAQRRRLGWPETAISTEAELLIEEIEHVIRATAGVDSELLARASSSTREFVLQMARWSRGAYRVATARGVAVESRSPATTPARSAESAVEPALADLPGRFHVRSAVDRRQSRDPDPR